MTKNSRIRLAVAAALMAALSLTTVGATAGSADAGRRTGDLWCC